MQQVVQQVGAGDRATGWTSPPHHSIEIDFLFLEELNDLGRIIVLERIAESSSSELIISSINS